MTCSALGKEKKGFGGVGGVSSVMVVFVLGCL